MKSKKWFVLGPLAVVLGVIIGSLPAQPPAEPKVGVNVEIGLTQEQAQAKANQGDPAAIAAMQKAGLPIAYPRGRVAPQNLPHLRALKAFEGKPLPPVCDLAEYDARSEDLIPPIKNQGQCGSCWLFSGVEVVETAYRKAKMGTPNFSEQYFLSCGKSGGCNGDDNTTLLAWARNHGVPLTSDYGPYQGRQTQCKYRDSMPLHKITEWGFADGSSEPGYDRATDTQLIKNAIKAYGIVGCAVAAGPSWDGYRAGQVHHGSSRNIDHDVALVGWKDDKSLREGGYWIMRNSWGTSWGDQGYMLIAYGADQIGTEAVMAWVDNPNPPPGPGPAPVPPGPCPHLLGVHVGVWMLVVGVVAGGLVVFIFLRKRKAT